MKSGITAAFDTSVRPQDDLFGYVNNIWVRDTPIPGDRSRYGSFDRLREQAESDMRAIIEEAAAGDQPEGSPARKVGDLYRSFMDTDRIDALGTEPLGADLRAIEAVVETSSFARQMGRLIRHDVPGAVAAYVTADAKDPERYIAYFEQDGLGLPDESYYREEKYAAVREQYLAHIEKLLGLAGVRDAAQLAPAVMEVETRLAAGHWDVVATRDAVKTYNKFTFAQLEEQAPQFDWRAWADGLNAPSGAFDHVVVQEPSFLTALSDALRDLPLTSWKAWMTWRLVGARARYLSAEIVEEDFAFNGRILSGTPELKDRWKRGVELVEGAIGEAAGELYVQRHFPPRAKERMIRLVGNIVEAYRRDFESLEWMSEPTRAQALDKLSKFTPKIGYPDKWRDYGTLQIDADDLVGNVERAARFEISRQLDRIGSPIDRTEWLMTPQTVNAYYHPFMNEIVFPAAILQPPFFDVDADDAVNYGGIGAVIGHEIGHGFDDQGSRFAGDGSLTDWWTEEDRKRFDTRAQKLIEQFNQLEPADAPGNKVNGGLTVGENIGDLGGLTIGYQAYRISTEETPAPDMDGFTGAQRFFIGWAQVWCGKAREAEAIRLLAIDPHAPANCRCNVARNLREFHETFGVKEGDGMYLSPQEQVRIF